MPIAARIMTGILRTEVPAKVPRRRTAISRADDQTANRNCNTCRYTGYSFSATASTSGVIKDPHHSSNPKMTSPTAKYLLILHKQSLTVLRGKSSTGGG